MVSLLALAAGVNDAPAVVPVMSKQRGKESQELIESGSEDVLFNLSRRRNEICSNHQRV